jgi:hypothetical protein
MKKDYRLLYFLGAGAAKPCGYLTTPELYMSLVGERPNLALLKEYGGSLSRISEDKPLDIETLYTMVSTKVSKSLADLYNSVQPATLPERLLFDLLRHHQSWKEQVQNLQQAFDEAKKEIFDFIVEKFWRTAPNTDPCGELSIQAACGDLGFQNVSVFTTNYDTSLERALTDFVPYTVGLIGDTFTPSELFPQYPDKLRIFKLHGSLDFYRLKDGRVVRINYQVNPGPWGGEDEVVGPYLVPPEEGKVDYDEKQESLLKVFGNEVAKANAIAIIGSSLRDNRLAEILSIASKNCQILLACGSKSNEIRDRWFEKHRKVMCETEHFPNGRIRDWFTVQIDRRGKWPGP